VAGVGVAGSTTNDRPIGSFVLQHYGEAGRLRWTVQPTNSLAPDPAQVRLCDMAVTNAAIWLFGQYGAGGALFKFDQHGNQLWSYAASESATASRMLVDHVGNAYLVHSSTNAITVTRVDPDGKLVDESAYSIPAGQTMTVQAVAIDSHGRLYLGGGQTDQSGHAAMMFLRFDPQISAFSLTTDDHSLAAAGGVKAITIDPSGDIYVTGYLANAAGRSIQVTSRYTSALQMEKLPDGPLRLRYVTAPQQPLTLEATQDFVDWRAIATNRADATGFVQFEDADAATLPLRFYRTRTDTAAPAPLPHGKMTPSVD
jgi:streptogramin lyase